MDDQNQNGLSPALSLGDESENNYVQHEMTEEDTRQQRIRASLYEMEFSDTPEDEEVANLTERLNQLTNGATLSSRPGRSNRTFLPRGRRRTIANLTGRTILSSDYDDEDDDSRGYYQPPDIPSIVSCPYEDALNKLLLVHSVNTFNIMKRYMAITTDELMECQFNPRGHNYFDFRDINLKPLELLNTKEFTCMTELIILVRDKQTYVDWGSQWTSILLDELKSKKLHPMCFTLLNQNSTKTMENMLNDLPEPIKSVLDFIDDMDKLEKLMAMSTLSRILQYWNVPILIIDSGPRHILDYKSILDFAHKADIKVLKFGANKTSSKEISKIKKKCRAKAAEIIKIRDEYLAKHQLEEEEAIKRYQEAEKIHNFGSPNSVPHLPPLQINPGRQIIEMHDVSTSVPFAWSQLSPFNNKLTQKRDKQEKREKILNVPKINIKDHILVGDEIPIPAFENDDDRDWESLPESDAGSSSQIIDEELMETPSNEKSCITNQKLPLNQRPRNNNAVDADESIIEHSSKEHEDIFGTVGMPCLTHILGGTASSVHSRLLETCSSIETSDLEDVDNSAFKFIRPIEFRTSKKFMRTPSPSEEVPYDRNTIHTPLKIADIDNVKNMLKEFDKNHKLRRLLKYYRKMTKDYNSVDIGTEPRVPQELDFTRGYTQGRSSTLDIQLDEWGLYMTPVNLVLSPYEMDYLKKKMVTERLPYMTNFMGWVMRESTSIFIDSIINVCCGSTHRSGPRHLRYQIRSVIFIHDNNDVLELLTNALWFCGKTVLATVQSQYYCQEDYFEKSVDACKSFVKEDAEDEPLYLDWLGVGMNQIIHDAECRFFILDFPRPGKNLNNAFEKIMEKLKLEYEDKGINTLYVAKSVCRADNLATAERVLDIIQNKLSAQERILFRRSRKIYLDAKLYTRYEMECLDDEKRDKDWGLPETDGSRLWQQLRLKHFELFTKPSSCNLPAKDINFEIRAQNEDLMGNGHEGCFKDEDIGIFIGSENSEVESFKSEDETVLSPESDDQSVSEDDFDALFEEGSSEESISDIDSVNEEEFYSIDDNRNPPDNGDMPPLFEEPEIIAEFLRNNHSYHPSEELCGRFLYHTYLNTELQEISTDALTETTHNSGEKTLEIDQGLTEESSKSDENIYEIPFIEMTDSNKSEMNASEISLISRTELKKPRNTQNQVIEMIESNKFENNTSENSVFIMVKSKKSDEVNTTENELIQIVEFNTPDENIHQTSIMKMDVANRSKPNTFGNQFMNMSEANIFQENTEYIKFENNFTEHPIIVMVKSSNSEVNASENQLIETAESIRSENSNASIVFSESKKSKVNAVDNEFIELDESKKFNETSSETKVVKITVKSLGKNDYYEQYLCDSDSDTDCFSSKLSDPPKSEWDEVETVVTFPARHPTSLKDDSIDEYEVNDNQAISLHRCEGVMNLVDQNLFIDNDRDELYERIAKNLNVQKQEEIEVKSLYRSSKDNLSGNGTLPMVSHGNEDDVCVTVTSPDTQIPKKLSTTNKRNSVNNENISLTLEKLWENPNKSETTISQTSLELEGKSFPIGQDEKMMKSRFCFAKIFRSRVSPETINCSHQGITEDQKQIDQQRQTPQSCTFQLIEAIFLKPCRTIYGWVSGIRKNVSNN